jgi:succinate dehydrogenase / fumarate reductase, cytochrome b subunit
MFMELVSALRTSIVRKMVVALTGLGLCFFTLTHLMGNLLVFVGPDAFNSYGHALISNKLIYVLEAGLALTFLVHLALALKLTLENHQARPEKYFMKKNTGRGATFASSTMPYTGMIILVFIIYHLSTIKYGASYEVTVDGVVMRDLYRLLVEHFSSSFNSFLYVLAVCALGVHVSHGLWSAFQSLGLNHPKYTPKVKLLSCLFGLLVAVGYSSIALWVFFFKGGAL